MRITVKCKLLPTRDQYQQLLDTMTTVNRACNWLGEYAFEHKLFNKITLQKDTYYDLKQTYNLSAQIAIRAIGKVADSYGDYKKRVDAHTFKKFGAIEYDARNFTIKKDNIMSVSVLGGRIKIPYMSRRPLSSYTIASQCKLSYDRHSNTFYILLSVEQPEAAPFEPKSYLGVDLGVINLATCSDGTNFSGGAVEVSRKKYTTLRANLQSKGTKSAKRHLKRLSGKEARFKTNTNHCISKEIVSKAKAHHCGIKLEDLQIPKRTVKKFTKELRDFNAKLGKWAFGQISSFITYKAKIVGVPVLFIDPAYTSQTCSECGCVDKESRKTQSEFCCTSCGYTANADFNAAINISKGYINKPIVATVSDGKLQATTSLE